jgi:hypothetical protein
MRKGSSKIRNAILEKIEASSDDAGPDRVPKSRKQFPLFKGYPYLLIRITSGFFHINLLSKEHDNHEWFLRIAQAQADANKLGVCLMKNEHVAVYFSSKGEPSFSEQLPIGHTFIRGRLRLSVDEPPGLDLLQREQELEAFIESTNHKGYLLGDLKKGGRKPTQEELLSLHGFQDNGLPRGLGICPVCGDYRGECLDPSNPYYPGFVVRVSCYCENDNLCAYCGGVLNNRKLNGNRYEPKDGKIWHTPGFCGLKHRCPGVSKNI